LLGVFELNVIQVIQNDIEVPEVFAMIQVDIPLEGETIGPAV
jgi:hypothetical protein